MTTIVLLIFVSEFVMAASNKLRITQYLVNTKLGSKVLSCYTCRTTWSIIIPAIVLAAITFSLTPVFAIPFSVGGKMWVEYLLDKDK